MLNDREKTRTSSVDMGPGGYEGWGVGVELVCGHFQLLGENRGRKEI